MIPAFLEPVRPYEFSGNVPCRCATCLAAEAAGLLADDRAAWTGARTS